MRLSKRSHYIHRLALVTVSVGASDRNAHKKIGGAVAVTFQAVAMLLEMQFTLLPTVSVPEHKC